jgi:hypothetical protein
MVCMARQKGTTKEIRFNGHSGQATLTVDARSAVKKMGPDRYLVQEPGEKARVRYLSGSSISAREPLPSETFNLLPDLE